MSEVKAVSNAPVNREEWLPIMDYAMKRNISVSTLRRYIKAKKVQYRIENGRYLIHDSESDASSAQTSSSYRHERRQSLYPVQSQDAAPTASTSSANVASAELQARVKKLESNLQQAQEEIAELKMLVALYEEQLSPHHFDN